MDLYKWGWISATVQNGSYQELCYGQGKAINIAKYFAFINLYIKEEIFKVIYSHGNKL